MNKTYSIFLCLCLKSFCFGQAPELLQRRGDSLYQAKNYSSAAIAYSEAVQLSPIDQPGQLFRRNLLVAKSWALAKMPDSAFARLDRIAKLENLVYVDLSTLTTDPDFSALHTDSRWGAINKGIFENVTRESHQPLDTSYKQEEIIYGRKNGMALTMLHLTPKAQAKDKAVLLIRSGGWGSSFYMSNTKEATMYLQEGYHVFIVFHGSEPVYNVADAMEDIQRAVRFIRYNARVYSISPVKIASVGYSAAGHLALVSGLVDSSFIANSPDPVDQVSSKVQAVVSGYPVSDFFTWDEKGNNAFSAFLFKQAVPRVLEFKKWNAQRRRFDYVTDSIEIARILKQVSPVNHVSAKDAPALILHGDKDELVPVQQSAILEKRLKDAGVPVWLYVKKNGGHGWLKTEAEDRMIMDWLNKHLQ